MNHHIPTPPRVANPPAERPLMVFDGDCSFCKFWIARWSRATAGRVDYKPYQEVATQYPEIPLSSFEGAVQLIQIDGTVLGGAEAVFRAMSLSEGQNWQLSLLRRIPGFDRAAAGAYGFVARQRMVFSFPTRLFWGRTPEPPTYFFTQGLFLRMLAMIYLVAFASLAVQITGLAGQRGIVPAAEFLQAVRGQVGVERFWLLPTLCWITASDSFLVSLCVAGALISCLALAGVLQAACLFLLWAVYLSLVNVGGPFLSFQWDSLLLETGFFAIFLAPLRVWPGRQIAVRAPPVARWLLLWLLFRLMFESGVVKLSSGDATWHGLTALTYHYETQPLPLWTSWYVNQAPLWFQKFSVLAVFAIEFGGAALIVAPRNLRRAGALSLIFLQLLIAVTGNYAFFNLLTIALCLLLLDDALIAPRTTPQPMSSRRWPLWILAPLAAICLLVSVPQLIGSFRTRMAWPRPILSLHSAIAPFRTINSYGLFAVMTTTRPEIIVEGSADGLSWLPYEFRWKPGDVNARPRLVAPHQPRLDWQMWFAALGTWRDNEWFIRFLARLLEGSPEVIALLASNPFPDAPPRYVRAEMFDYKFTRRADGSGAWWKRELKGEYCPEISLRVSGESPR